MAQSSQDHMHSLNQLNVRNFEKSPELEVLNPDNTFHRLRKNSRINRWSWDVLGSVGNAPNRSRAAILEDAYSSLTFRK